MPDDLTTIGIDWSGREDETAAGKHIWRATVRNDVLVDLRFGLGRRETVDWLLEEASKWSNMAVGFDFAFGFPQWFGHELGAESASDVWTIAAERGEEWIKGADGPFWDQKRAHPERREQFRLTEQCGFELTGLTASSVFKLVGSGQVGRGSIRGMPELTRLSTEGFSVWPFAPPSNLTVVEMFPRWIYERLNKSSRVKRLQYLERFSFVHDAFRDMAGSSDDAFDAVAIAFALAENPPVPGVVAPDEAAMEGWIWDSILPTTRGVQTKGPDSSFE